MMTERKREIERKRVREREREKKGMVVGGEKLLSWRNVTAILERDCKMRTTLKY